MGAEVTDIVDEIDALVDEQLSSYSQRTGYDYNASQDRCWHCGRDWHGLKITARMEEMRQVYQQEVRRLEYLGEGETGYAESVIDPDYRHADDDSEVLCPGSSFIGPWATKRQIESIRSSESTPYTLDSLMQMRAAFFGRVRPNPYLRMREPGEPGIESAPYMYAFPQRVVLGVDVSAGGTTEVSQVIIDEGRPYRYGEDFSFAGPTIPPEMQFPREGPYAASRSFNRMQHAINQLRGLGVLDEPLAVRRWLTGDPEPDTRTPQERALPRPSATPPMWAVQVGTQRRTRTNSRRRHR